MSEISVKPIDIGNNNYSITTYGIQFVLNGFNLSSEGPLKVVLELYDDDYEGSIVKSYYFKRLIITPYEMYYNHIDGEYLNSEFQFLKIKNPVRSCAIQSMMELRHICLKHKKIHSVVLRLKAQVSKVFRSIIMKDGFDLYINNKLEYMFGHRLNIGVSNVFIQE